MLTLNKITASFNKTLKQLDTFISKQDVSIAFARDDIMNAQERERVLQQDLDKAKRIKKNIEGIIQ